LTNPLAASVRAGLPLAALALLAACSGAPGDAAPPSVAPGPPLSAKGPLPSGASPIDARLPSIVLPNLPLRALCRIGTCMLANPVPDSLLRDLPERAPVMIWEQRLGAGAKMVFPADREVELAAVVLEGSVGLLSRESQGGGSPAGMTQWQGFHAPGAGVTLTAIGKDPARLALVLALATHSADTSLAGHVGRWSRNHKPFEAKPREKAIEPIDFPSLPAVSWGQGAYHARIGWEVPGPSEGGPGAKDASAAALPPAPAMVLSLLRFSKNAAVATHVHEKERECLVVLEGEGQLQLSPEPPGQAAAPAGESAAVEPGMVVCIPSGMWHAFKPSGKSPFLAIQVYTPPGPELRFKQLAGSKAP
jgi:mannose-6-phosphate isomerase-like protein (cupin superfamily)